MLWEGILAQWMISSLDSDEPIGHCSFYGANATNKHCFFQLWIDPTHRRGGWPIEGAILALDVVMHRFDMRKVYIEVAESLLPQYESIMSVPGIAEEGRLKQHIFLDGREQDVHIIALYRDRWPAMVRSVLGATPRSHND